MPALRASGIKYVFLGRELGARSDDPCHYVGGNVQYDRLSQSALFREGINRVIDGATRYRIALLCAVSALSRRGFYSHSRARCLMGIQPALCDGPRTA